jgi:tetratricopeptide (TPR) repeat protein
MKPVFPVALALAAVLFTGPSLPLTGDPIEDGRIHIEQGPAKDRVLWQYRTAIEAMRRGRYDEAKRLLDAAIASIGGILQGDADARRARRLFSQESDKKFVGEPYERIMAYFYRGVLYWMDGEPDNARACFRSGLIIDSDTEEKTYSADYVLLEYLDGYVTARLGGDGKDALERARKFSKLELPPDFDREANVMVFLEYGYGPTKFAAGEYGELLQYRDNQSRSFAARVNFEGGEIRARPYDDIYFQAITRGGRVMDHILKNQAKVKKATDTAGDVGIAKADTRSWDNLPQFLSFAALRLPPGPHTIEVEFLDKGGRPIPKLLKVIHVTVPSNPQDTVLFVSEQTQATPSDS